MKSIHTEVRKFFRRESVPRGVRILAAVSGGPDSTALALCLAEMREELGFSLALAHYDHGLRSAEEAAVEEAFALSLGRLLGLPVETGRAGTGKLKEIAGRKKLSLEAAARNFRYAFLRETAKRLTSDFIALGHTRTDRIETQVFRFFQGSSVEALAGIRGRRGRIIRPLIAVDRRDVLAFLAERGQDFCTDSSNADMAFLRNHVRGKLVPAAEDVFPGFAKALDALAEKSHLYSDFVKKTLRGVSPWVKADLGWECSFEAFAGLHPILRINSVYEIFNQGSLGQNEKRIPYAFLRPLAKLTEDRPDGVILRGRGLALVRRGDRLLARRDIVLNRKKGYFYLIDGNMDFCVQGRLRVEAEEVLPEWKNGKDVFSWSKGDCLFLRSRRPGDTVCTGQGKKTLNKLFSDWKVGEGFRDIVPLVQKNENILAVFAEPFGGKTLRLGGEAGPEAGKFFRIRIRVCESGEESGQTKQSE
ncbi:MAG: tRNA lysidine(34) synthetase TilS [Spirochaetales bacterium]|jgi:tRNA(Ile)-lysidine synthase|nr:tRNA lysidine(34) synthetase TilS [Spirochaetales bacterium]